MEIADSICIMKALADSSRLMVFRSLMDGPQYVEQLAERFDLAPSTVSFHLKKLEQAGLVEATKEQYYVIYRINAEILERTLKELTCFDNIQRYVEDERLEKYRQKVIHTFFKRQKLMRLPAQRKKRLIVLEEFSRKFKPDVIYKETEVNDIIGKSFADYCTIRRELVEEQMMQRENREYRLTVHERAQ
jgi:hypothetical protein